MALDKKHLLTKTEGKFPQTCALQVKTDPFDLSYPSSSNST